ncbi:MAG TPA: TIGR01777 family protein [Opitutae bacterium]|nr:TIGR01777 family protein [Opitutae bacterium]
MSELKTILVTGASGLVGRPLCAALEAQGYAVRRLSRGEDAEFQWDVEAGHLDAAAVRGVTAIIHLAGETVAQRWSDEAKTRILSSRVDSTQMLADAILQTEERPIFISASGISYYGVESEELVTESSETGDGFLAEVTRQWEGASQTLMNSGCRVVWMRTGIVLSRQGGALAKMLTPFKMGVGGRIGGGRQKMSWVSLPDLVNMYLFALETPSIFGALNAVAPQPVSNLEFTKTLGFVIGRPTIFPLPSIVVKTLFGEMGNETVLSDLGVMPKQLEAVGYEWVQPELEGALRETIYGDN